MVWVSCSLTGWACNDGIAKGVMVLTFFGYQTGLALARLSKICQACHVYPVFKGYLCQGCLADTHWLPPKLAIKLENGLPKLSVQPATYYDGVMRQAISSFKDYENTLVLPYLVHGLHELAESVAHYNPYDTVILPTPTTKGRLSERGFDPVSILAVQLSQLTAFDLYHGVVRRGEQMHQRGLDRQERLSNLTEAFVLEYLPDASCVVLFDDVATTGATLKALATTLLNANPALTVCALCLAHGSPTYLN